MPRLPSPDTLLPKPKELYSRLVDEVRFLKDQAGMKENNKNSLERSYHRLSNQEPTDWTLNIQPNWIIKIEAPDERTQRDRSRDFSNDDGWAVIGGYISVRDNEYTNYSINLTILAGRDSEYRGQGIGDPCCWDGEGAEDAWRVAKQYHFDIDVGDNDDESKPITHFQSRGKFDPDRLPNAIWESVHYCSTPLDKPRLPFPPMDPVLLVQIIKDQYGCPEQLHSEYWGSEVLDSESMLWGSYYSGIAQHMDDDNRSDPFDSLLSNGRMNS